DHAVAREHGPRFHLHPDVGPVGVGDVDLLAPAERGYAGLGRRLELRVVDVDAAPEALGKLLLGDTVELRSGGGGIEIVADRHRTHAALEGQGVHGLEGLAERAPPLGGAAPQTAEALARPAA